MKHVRYHLSAARPCEAPAEWDATGKPAAGARTCSPQRQTKASGEIARLHSSDVAAGYKPALLGLALASLCSLATLAQDSAGSSYLSAPDGQPAKAVVVDDIGRIGFGTETPSNWFTFQPSSQSVNTVVKSSDKVRNIFELREKANGDGEPAIRNAEGFQIAVLRSGNLVGQDPDHNGKIAVLTHNGHITAQIAAVGNTYFTGGNVGVGTDTPTAMLDVAKSFKVHALKIERKDLEGQAATQVYTDPTVNREHLILGARGRADLVIRRETGNIGVGIGSPEAKMDVAGNVRCHVLELTGGAGGLAPAAVLHQTGTVADGPHPVALIGRAYVWADASFDEIKAGDELTSSTTPGHVMKATDDLRANRAVLGTALTSLKQGQGLVLAVLQRR